MPRVPSAQPQVQSRALPGVRAQGLDVSSGLEALAQGTQQAGAGLVRMGEAHAREMEQLNRARVQDAWTRHAARQNDILRGAMERRGQQAAGVDGWGLAEFDKSLEEVAKELTPEQRKMLGSVAQKDRVSFENALKTHRDKEFHAFKDTAAEAAAKAAMAKGALVPTDEAREEARRLGEAAVVARGADRGEPPEAIEQRRQAYNTDFDVQVLTRLEADGDGAGMLAYLEKRGPTMEPAARARAEKSAQALSARQAVFALAPQLQAAAPGNLTEQLRLARERAGGRPEVYDALVDRLTREDVVARRATDEAHEQRRGRLLLGVYDTSSIDRTSKDWQELDDMGRAQVAAALDAQRARDRAFSEAKRRDSSQADALAVEQFRGLPPEVQRTVDVGRWTGVSELGRARLVTEQKRAVEDHTKGLLPRKDDWMARVKAKASGLSKKDAAALESMAADWWANWDRSGKPPTHEQLDAALKALQRDVYVDKSRLVPGTSKVPVYKLKPGQQPLDEAGNPVPDPTDVQSLTTAPPPGPVAKVPPAARTRITQRAGVPLSEAELERIYRREQEILATQKGSP